MAVQTSRQIEKSQVAQGYSDSAAMHMAAPASNQWPSEEVDLDCGDMQPGPITSAASSPESLQGGASRQYSIVISPRSGKQGGGQVSLMQSGVEFRSVDFEGTKNRDGIESKIANGSGVEKRQRSKTGKESRVPPAVPILKLERAQDPISENPQHILSGKLAGWASPVRGRYVGMPCLASSV